MPSLVIMRREFQATFRLFDDGAPQPGILTGSSAPTQASFEALGLTPAAIRSVRLVGAWIADVTPQLQSLADARLVWLIDTNFPLRVFTGTANQPTSGEPWHLNLVGLNSATRVNGGAGVRVGIVDSGADGSSAELSGRIATWATCDSNGVTPGVGQCRDYGANRHGTHVASLIAGRTLGIAPAAMLSVAALAGPPGSLPVGALYQALKWLREDEGGRRRADVINLSLYCGLCPVDLSALLDQSTLDLIITAAVGNLAVTDECAFPSTTKDVVAVGSYDSNRRWGYTSFGFHYLPPAGVALPPEYRPKPQLHAPGVNVQVTPQGATGDGSSFASAIVAGAAAVLLARNPALNTPKNGKVARELLFSKTTCLRFDNRDIPGAWSPWLEP